MKDSERLRLKQKCKDDFLYYSQRALFIRGKSGIIQPLLLNHAQRYIHDCIEDQRKKTGKVRAILLKGRQQGASTYVEGRFYWLVTHRKGVRAFILTHEADATNNLFEMAKRYHDHCIAPLRPSTGGDSAKSLEFDKLDSAYKVGTAGNKAVGRSSTIQFFHGSEVSFWPNAAEHAKGVMQAIPDEHGTEVILESTANGVGNFYHEQVQKAISGEGDFIFIFVPWFWQPEYSRALPDDFTLTDEEADYKKAYGLTDEQIAWRRNKIVELSSGGGDGGMAFKQEYPATATEAFQVTGSDKALISNEAVMAARASGLQDSYGALVVGVDPARYGKDRTSIIRRRGRKAFKLEYHKKISTMEVVGRVVRIIQQEKPARVFVDVVGIGAGVVDRLREMGFGEIVRAVNGGEAALDPERYANRRAEMWCLGKKWLDDKPVRIPNNDELHADLTGPQHTFDSKGRVVLEKKTDMQKRGLRSPDGGDALMNTFYEPVAVVKKKLPVPPPPQPRRY